MPSLIYTPVNGISEFGDLVGHRIDDFIVKGREHWDQDEILFYVEGDIFRLSHFQDCCESVYIEDIDAPPDSLVPGTIQLAEEITEPDASVEDGQWTFYKFGTERGATTIRWYGTSNGYYSIEVHFDHIGTYVPEQIRR